MRRNTKMMLAAGCAVCFGGVAQAQNALGDGQALDNSLQVGRTRNAARADYRQEMAFRNSITTGNAPGGLSFRGDVGYRSPSEFRGDLGEDTLFSFRRDSLYSGLAGMGIRGIEAVQYQFALTTGARPPENLVGSLIMTRGGGSYSGYSAVGDLGAGATTGVGARTETVGRIDMSLSEPETGSMGGLLRSASAYTADRSMQPVLIGTLGGGAESAQMGVTASPLRGVRLTMMGDGKKQSRRPEGAGDQRLDWSVDSRLGDERKADQTEQSQAKVTAYDQVLARLRGQAEQSRTQREAQAAEELQPDAWWQKELDDLTRSLNLPGGLIEAPNVNDLGLPGESGGEAGDGSETQGEFGRPQRYNPRTIDLLREQGDPIRDLVEPGVSADDLYVAHMRAGERLVAGGRYFDAEERFTRALAVRPGDVTAQVGRVHAQLGAGLFVSAALNLRQAFMAHPEMIGTRFVDDLLPDEQRRADLLIVLREHVGVIVPEVGAVLVDDRMKRDGGLLLAYLGHQIGDGKAVSQGLASMRGSVEAGTAPGDREPADLRLVELLEGVWLADESGGE